MHLSLQINVNETTYTVKLDVSHKDNCILSIHFEVPFYHNHNDHYIDTLKGLSTKIKRLYHAHTPLELFSDSTPNKGDSLSLSFARNAFLVETTTISDGKSESSNYIYLLRNSEVIQFHCEILQAFETLDITINDLIKKDTNHTTMDAD